MNRYRITTFFILLAIFCSWFFTGRLVERATAGYTGVKMPLEQLAIPGPSGQNATDWSLAFHDEFDGAALDRTKWRSDYGNGGHEELQEYVNDDSHYNYIMQNGILRIAARRESYNGRAYTSGVITTQDRFFMKYGFFEMRARLSSGKGLWPAFWMLPNPTGWPPEIDVIEYLGHQPNTIYMTLHYANPTGEDQNYYNGPDYSAGWHTFGLRWDASAIIWYIDGVERKRFTDASKIPNMPMFILANLAVGGTWPGSPDSTTVFPAYYDIDYIRAWKKAGSSALPDNLLANGSFDASGSSPWFAPWNIRNDLDASFEQDGNADPVSPRSFKATLYNQNSSQPWMVAIMQQGKVLAAGKTYSLSFWAKSSVERQIRTIIQDGNSPFTEYQKWISSLTTSWQQFHYTFNAPAATSNAMINFNLAGAAGSVWLDEVSFCPGTSGCAASAKNRYFIPMVDN
ncbi:MAG: family 16 glycosylhydrolase [Omnitrophica WOR_2 bacterium]